MLVALDRRAVALAGLLAACADPKVPDLGDPPAAEDYFADVLVAHSLGAEEPETCIAGPLPACGDEVPDCGPQEVLGPRDGVSHTLGAFGKIDVGFRCAPVVDRGGDEGDLRIWATLPNGGRGRVYHSVDGLTYHEWFTLTAPNQIFDFYLTDQASYARFIRVVGEGAGVTIDGFEVLNDDSVGNEIDAGAPGADAGPDAAAPDAAPAI